MTPRDTSGNWTGMLAALRSELIDDDEIAYEREYISQLPDKPPHWQRVKRLASKAVPIIALLGPDAIRPQLASCAPIIRPDVDRYVATQNDVHFGATTLLHVAGAVSLLDCLGIAVDGHPLQSLRPLLVRATTSRDDEFGCWHWNRALTALALDERRVWGPIAGLREDQEVPFDAGQVFQFNMQGLIAHLAGARLHGASYADVAPAWTDFLNNVPLLASTHATDWLTLLWGARVVYHDVGGEPLSSVAERLHQAIQAAAGQRGSSS